MYEYISQDDRYMKLKRNKRDIVFSWTQREYRNLLLARDHITVPTPRAIKDNIIVMDFIGDDDPAPKVKDHAPLNAQDFFDIVIEFISKLAKAGLVHGDLSEYNILNYHDRPVFIDFSQATTTLSPNAKALLERDVKNVCNFFRKLGVKTDPEAIVAKVIKGTKKTS
jgi:RIO kinase 1